MQAVEASDGRLTALAERRLIERAQIGCRESSHALVVAYQNRLHAFVCRMVKNPHEAEEVCQDTFLRAFGALDTFDFNYRFSTWLFTIGYRLCLNSLRRRKDYSGDMDFSAMAASGRNDSDDLPLADAVANSDEAKRLRKIIWEAVDQLTPQQRATVLLFYREAMSCQEIGDVLEMPAATVKSHLHRARNRLKELLESHLVEDWSMVRFGTGGGSA
jgi:RNA polymerase sigma-70 factor, ECF subfamily